MVNFHSNLKVQNILTVKNNENLQKIMMFFAVGSRLIHNQGFFGYFQWEAMTLDKRKHACYRIGFEILSPKTKEEFNLIQMLLANIDREQSTISRFWNKICTWYTNNYS